MSFYIKQFLAFFMSIFKVTDKKINNLAKKYNNNYIRIVNYHDVSSKDLSNFERQMKYYTKNFKNVSYQEFEKFLSIGEMVGNKPGIMLTFDDGLKGNFENAKFIIEKYNFTGYFFIPSDLIGKENHMNYLELKALIQCGHTIGSHTATHHRMNFDDNSDTLYYEIKKSKDDLEKNLGSKIDIFCWCGGEEKHYTKAASDVIKKYYKYGFMTNSYPIVKNNNPYQIQRINVEASWTIALTKFQISGFMDNRLKEKRKRININCF